MKNIFPESKSSASKASNRSNATPSSHIEPFRPSHKTKSKSKVKSKAGPELAGAV